MNKSIFTALVINILMACEKAPTKAEAITNEKISIDINQDDHGCNTSSGEIWSILQNNCIQLYNIGFRLNPISTSKNQTVISAFIIFSNDKSKIELFMPETHTSQSIILDNIGENNFEGGIYKYDAYNSILFVNGVQKFKGNVE